MTRKTAVLICPGRGTYNKSELGTLARTHADHPSIAEWDEMRREMGQETLTSLDGAARFSAAQHTTGDNASALIYACSLLDAQLAISSHDIVAVTGNSLGWYIALAVGGAADARAGMHIVNTMGTLMHQHGPGGQILLPFVDDNWQPIPGEEQHLLGLIAQINSKPNHTLSLSIHLGGMLVVAGNDAGLNTFETTVSDRSSRKPLRLPNHAAFHTEMMQQVAAIGRDSLPNALLNTPKIALIDGRGTVWHPHASDTVALYDYTFDHQITRTYDFTKAIQSAARNFAPDRFVITGPGATLGGAVAQALIAIKWQGIDSKEAFLARQTSDPILISMGREDQRALAL
ncbi:ACP S-malonyltransferase [uncultured Sulfitobacter sp.]|uniref:ACP S-malonyltransferase n=1 Tax=uncultured Sulfitobacter sp. TaxID=191468 RepID=UPI002637DC17|nr:ACP S-malonyltransferase [uncultured Sulfitobacter sp.]